MSGAVRAPWWALIGGVLGAFYVMVALLTVRTLGLSALTAVVVSGQLAIAVLVDRFGLLGISKQHIGAPRIAGLVLLVLGVVLVVRKLGAASARPRLGLGHGGLGHGGELVRVADHVDRDDKLAIDRQCDHRQEAVGVAHHESGRAVDVWPA